MNPGSCGTVVDLMRRLCQTNWREPADQRRSQLSRGEMTPFGERGSAFLLKGIGVVEVAVVSEAAEWNRDLQGTRREISRQKALSPAAGSIRGQDLFKVLH